MKSLFFLFCFSFGIFAQTNLNQNTNLFSPNEFDKAVLTLNIYDIQNNSFYLEIDFSKYPEEKPNVLPKFLLGQALDFNKYYWEVKEKEFSFYRDETQIPVIFLMNETVPLEVSSVYCIRESKKVYLFLYGGSSSDIQEVKKVSVSLYEKDSKSFLTKIKEINIPESMKYARPPVVLDSIVKGVYPGKPISFLGYNLDKVSRIYLMDKKLGSNGLMNEAYLQYEDSGITVNPISEADKEFISPSNKDQVKEKLTFSLHGDYNKMLNDSRDVSFAGKYFGVKLDAILYSNGRVSSPFEITLLSSHWKKYAIFFSVFIIFILVALVGIITRKLLYLPNLLIDTNTNSYSLSALQAFCWTVALLFSYGYIAFCRAIIIQSGEIPEFPSSLLILMGISYGGLLGVSSIQKFVPQKAHRRKEARLRDLFSVGEGDINLARVQLFGFNLLVLIVYIVNILIIDPLNELPEVPMTLEGLLIGSHAGYIGSKLVNDKVFINLIYPLQVFTKTEEQKLILIGGGFKEGIKVILDGEEPRAAKFISPNQIECILPVLQNSGSKHLTIVSSDGSMTEYISPIEIIEKNQKVEIDSTST
ncbi:MAG: IPT/TIG domain-containing protein [Leptospiraceae bacterium]|nr:IPT/TIG domain-containing protein [Leptospiraceae bacterium]